MYIIIIISNEVERVQKRHLMIICPGYFYQETLQFAKNPSTRGQAQ